MENQKSQITSNFPVKLDAQEMFAGKPAKINSFLRFYGLDLHISELSQSTLQVGTPQIDFKFSKRINFISKALNLRIKIKIF